VTALTRSGKGRQTLTTQRFETLQEAKTMFATFVDASLERGREQGLQEGLQQGLQQGLQEGRKEGLKEGLKEAALLLIKQRFGVNGDAWRGRLDPMDSEQLQRFLLRASAAASLDDLND
jgi:flagellar biosynthesis/type III secretory pathway protein FliH